MTRCFNEIKEFDIEYFIFNSMKQDSFNKLAIAKHFKRQNPTSFGQEGVGLSALFSTQLQGICHSKSVILNISYLAYRKTKTKLQQNCQFSFNAVCSLTSNCTSKNLIFLEALLTIPGA